MELGYIILLTVSVFLVLIRRFLLRDLSKFYWEETKRIALIFKTKDSYFGDLALTCLISVFIGVLAFIVYKTSIVLISYCLSSDLIDLLIKSRGVYANSSVAQQDPSLFKNILNGLILTPISQYLSILFMVMGMKYFMTDINQKNGQEVYLASSLVYFSSISCLTFLIIELFFFSQSISFVNTISNIIVHIGAKLAYILFFLSIIHIELTRNNKYLIAIQNDLSLNRFEKKLINIPWELITVTFGIAIFLNIPLYTGFQFGSNNWIIVLKLFLAGGVFYFILSNAFSKGYNFIGVYMIDDNRNHSFSTELNSHNIFNKFIHLGCVILTLILLVVNYKGLILFLFYLVITSFLLIVFILIVYGMPAIHNSSYFDWNVLKKMTLAFGKVVVSVLILVLFAFTLINTFPKHLDLFNYVNYQGSIVSRDGNILYFDPVSDNNPSSPIEYQKIPIFFIKGLVAKEDRGFFSQNSLIFNKRNWHGISSTGKSNINQQLIKNLAFEGAFPQEIQRKLSELIASYQLSIQYEPEEILTHYVNNVSFNGGSGHTGIVNASYYTFGRNITELNELEILYLLFTLHRGSSFRIENDRFVSYKEAHLHHDDIKEKLVKFASYWQKDNLISKKEFNRVKRQNLNFTNRKYHSENSASTNIFYANCIKNKSESDVVFTSDLTFENHAKIQIAVDRFYNKFSLYKFSNDCKLYSAILVIDVKSGSIIGHYGGKGVSDLADFANGNPVGSIIKPFVLLELLERGLPVWLYDGKRKNKRLLNNYNRICSKEYKNADGILGPSLNSPFGNIDEVTEPISLFLDMEEKFSMMGIKSDNSIDLYDYRKKKEYMLNYPLGSRRMTIYDIAQAYQTLFNNGQYVKLNLIKKSFDPYMLKTNDIQIEKKVIYERPNTYKIQDALKLVLKKGGTGATLNKYLPSDVQFMGKTGTTDKYKHGYTILCDSKTLVVCWLSYGKIEGNHIDFNNTPGIPLSSGGSSAGILAAFIFDELYK